MVFDILQTQCQNNRAAMNFIQLLQQSCALPVNDAEFQRGYARGLDTVSESGTFDLFGMSIVAPPGVYSPNETSSTRFFLSNFGPLGLESPRPGARLLEVGCGAGAISILAAKMGWQVTATDVDPAAVEATRDNATANGVDIEVLVSDLLAAVQGRSFDAIVFNQPFYHVDRDIAAAEATLADPRGELYVRFMAEAREAMAPGGFVGIAYANFSNPELFRQPGWSYGCCAFDYTGGLNTIRALILARPMPPLRPALASSPSLSPAPLTGSMQY